MKIYEICDKRKYFKTLHGAQQYILSLGDIEKVIVSVDEKEELKRGYFTDTRIYCKKKYISPIDYNDYEFYDCLTSGMSYTNFLLKNKCLECDTTIYFEKNIPPITIQEIEVLE